MRTCTCSAIQYQKFKKHHTILFSLTRRCARTHLRSYPRTGSRTICLPPSRLPLVFSYTECKLPSRARELLMQTESSTFQFLAVQLSVLTRERSLCSFGRSRSHKKTLFLRHPCHRSCLLCSEKITKESLKTRALFAFGFCVLRTSCSLPLCTLRCFVGS